MNRLSTLLITGGLILGSFSVTGCESTQSSDRSQNAGYAGGNGMYGEDPVQPGEHSADRFRNSTIGAPATQPTN